MVTELSKAYCSLVRPKCTALLCAGTLVRAALLFVPSIAFLAGIGCSGASRLVDTGTETSQSLPAPSAESAPEQIGFRASPFAGQIVINEVSSEGMDEIEFLNLQAASVDLSGWSYSDQALVPRDANAETHRFVFPAGTTVSGGAYLVVSKDTEHTFGLSGAGDSVWLFDADELLVDIVTWGIDEAVPSYCRQPNGMGAFETCAEKTLGARNDGASEGDAGPSEAENLPSENDAGMAEDGGFDSRNADAGQPTYNVVINEVTSSADDVIELKNTGMEDIDLSGWWFTDDGYDPLDGTTFDHRYDLTTGSVIPPGGYLVFVKNEHHSFGLGAEDAVSLFDDEGILVDRCAWGAGEATVSFCRFPDGTGPFLSCSEASLSGQNIE